MAKLLKLRRGTTSQHSSFTGAEGEVTVDTTKDTLVVHDGSTAGGVPLAKESDNLSLIDEDNMSTNSATRPPSQQSVKAYVDGLTGVPTTITVADESSDTTCFPLFVTAATGDLAPKTGSNITFNSSTGLLTAVGLTLSGDLTVNGTTTTINSTTLAVDDKNIELGSVDTPSDATADGGGITLKGATDKEFKWENSTDAWLTTEHIKIPDDKKLIVGSGGDLEIYHSSNETKLINQTGSIWLQSDNGIRFTDHGLNQSMAAFYDNGACELYHNGTKKIETTAAGVTVSGSVTDDKGNIRSIPQNTQGSTYTLVAADAGKHILASGTVTIPNSVFAAGDAVTIVNNTSGNLTLTASVGTLYNTADGATGNRTLATRGMATILFASATVAYISGAGLS